VIVWHRHWGYPHLATFEDLARHFQRQISLQWRSDLAPDYRVWILWYDHALERRVRGRLQELEALTLSAGHGWQHLDLADEFGRWIAQHEYFDGMLDMPEEVHGVLPAFADHLAAQVRSALAKTGPNDVLALTGTGSLFGVASVAALLTAVVPAIPGRLLVFFPGRHQAGIYRLLDAREGWNYRATPIPAADAA
jgi:hypothetical protein